MTDVRPPLLQTAQHCYTPLTHPQTCKSTNLTEINTHKCMHTNRTHTAGLSLDTCFSVTPHHSRIHKRLAVSVTTFSINILTPAVCKEGDLQVDYLTAVNGADRNTVSMPVWCQVPTQILLMLYKCSAGVCMEHLFLPVEGWKTSTKHQRCRYLSLSIRYLTVFFSFINKLFKDTMCKFLHVIITLYCQWVRGCNVTLKKLSSLLTLLVAYNILQSDLYVKEPSWVQH